MKNLIFIVIIINFGIVTSCELEDLEIDQELIGQWVLTDSLGGAWIVEDDQNKGSDFRTDGEIYQIMSDDGGVSWETSFTGVRFTKANNGIWATDISSHGTYEIEGDNMTWGNDLTSKIYYMTKIVF